MGRHSLRRYRLARDVAERRTEYRPALANDRPFPNTDNDGFAKIYPPEQEFDAYKKYDGLEGQIGWQDYNGNEPYLTLDELEHLDEDRGRQFLGLRLCGEIQSGAFDGRDIAGS